MGSDLNLGVRQNGVRQKMEKWKMENGNGMERNEKVSGKIEKIEKLKKIKKIYVF